MRNLKESFLLVLFISFGLSFSHSIARERSGMASGVFYAPINLKNAWYKSPGRGYGYLPDETEASVNQWQIPIMAGMYTEDFHFDISSEFGGWYLLTAFAGKPKLDNQETLQYHNFNIADISLAIKILDIGLPLFIGGQAGAGYMGMYTPSVSPVNFLDNEDYLSYGANAGTMVHLGSQSFRFVYRYDWILYNGEQKGNGYETRLEYYPFDFDSDLSFVHFLVSYENQTVPYPEDLFGLKGYEFSDNRINFGLYLSGIF